MQTKKSKVKIYPILVLQGLSTKLNFVFFESVTTERIL